MRATRPLRLLPALLVALVVGLGLAAPAQAAPVAAATPAAVVTAAQAAVPQADQYGRRFVITINCQVVPRGVTCTITITFARSGEVLTGTVFSTPLDLGTTTADPSGNASFSFSTEPLDIGEHTATVTGDGGYSQSVNFTVVAPAAAGGGASASGPTTSTGSGLAFTGSSAIIPLTTIGAILVLAGGGAVVASRRRRSA